MNARLGSKPNNVIGPTCAAVPALHYTALRKVAGRQQLSEIRNPAPDCDHATSWLSVYANPSIDPASWIRRAIRIREQVRKVDAADEGPATLFGLLSKGQSMDGRILAWSAPIKYFIFTVYFERFKEPAVILSCLAITAYRAQIACIPPDDSLLDRVKSVSSVHLTEGSSGMPPHVHAQRCRSGGTIQGGQVQTSFDTAAISTQLIVAAPFYRNALGI